MAIMRYLAMATIAIALFAAGYLAADLRMSDADAQGTWQYTFFDQPEHFVEYLETLPDNCSIDWETHDNSLGTLYSVAYSCPD